MLPRVPRRKRMRQTSKLLQPDIQLERDPLARIAVSAAPVVLEGRYRLLMRALWELRHSRRTRWGLGVGSAAVMLLLAFLAVRHFATTSWPLSQGQPGLLVAAGLLLLLARALRRCDADRGRAPLPRLPGRTASNQPLACHARSDRQRRAGATRCRRRG